MKPILITPEVVNYVLENHIRLSKRILSKKLKIAESTVARIIQEAGFGRYHYQLTAAERSFIINNYDRMSDKEISDQIQKSYELISDFRRKNQLERAPETPTKKPIDERPYREKIEASYKAILEQIEELDRQLEVRIDMAVLKKRNELEYKAQSLELRLKENKRNRDFPGD